MIKRFMIVLLLMVLLISLTGCSVLLSTGNRGEKREQIYTYVESNESSIDTVVQSLQGFPDDIVFIKRDNENGTLLAWKNAWTPVGDPITDTEICTMFEDSIKSITLGEAIVFYMGGLGIVTNSVYMGFYYSPQDIPLWVKADDEYLHYPMIEQDNGWIADKSSCANDDGMIKYYQIYTEKIMDCYYYYEVKL